LVCLNRIDLQIPLTEHAWTAFWLCQKMERKMKDKTIIGIAMIVAIAG
jgi:hypothetical protein